MSSLTTNPVRRALVTRTSPSTNVERLSAPAPTPATTQPSRRSWLPQKGEFRPDPQRGTHTGGVSTADVQLSLERIAAETSVSRLLQATCVEFVELLGASRCT